MINGDPDKQNKQGLKRLRTRYIARGKTLLKDKAFQRALADEGRKWNAQHEALAFHREVAPEGLQPSPFRTGIIFPPRLDQSMMRRYRAVRDSGTYVHGTPEEGAAHHDFWEAVKGLCTIGWPSRYYRYRPGLIHPCGPLVSAAILYHHATLVDDVEALVLPMVLQVESLPYIPTGDEHNEIAQLRAERDYLRSQIALLVVDRPEQLDQIRQDAWLAGSKAASKSIDERLGRPLPESFWFIPLLDGMAGEDLADSADEILSAVRQIYGLRTLNDDIAALDAEGISQSSIAALLGVTSRMVAGVLSSMPDRNGRG